METQNGRHTADDAGSERSDERARTGQTADPTTGRGRSPLAQQKVSVPPEPFEIFESAADGGRVIAPRGELDLSSAGQLEDRLAGNIDTVLDLSDLSFIDSTGIRVVVSTAYRAQSEAWQFTVRNPQPAVLRVFELVGVEQQLGLEIRERAPDDTTERSRLA